MKTRLRVLITAAFLSSVAAVAQNVRWSEKKVTDWYAREPWLVGSNYIPANAINELEMWQADTFDPARIDLELGWAESLGMNTMRVFLHDLLWQQDAPGFRKRIDAFLEIAERHKIKPMLVLFDSCWDPVPRLGKQREPTPGVHNSGWVQSPGAEALQDPAQSARLEVYVRGVVGAFAKDNRILAWDIWNEPDNVIGGSYGKLEPPNKVTLVVAMLPKAFAWARAAHPSQPLTSGVWKGDWSNPEKLTPMEKDQLELSDVISFHNYSSADDFEQHVKQLLQYHRPVLCTEYMARGNKSTFQGTLPVAKKYKVAAINWGLAAGKTQTWLPWDSWAKPYVDREPAVWHHEVFRTDGTPYRQDEVDFIRQMTNKR
jgi:Cellulase (glycosyl hydrolase family 5)